MVGDISSHSEVGQRLDRLREEDRLLDERRASLRETLRLLDEDERLRTEQEAVRHRLAELEKHQVRFIRRRHWTAKIKTWVRRCVDERGIKTVVIDSVNGYQACLTGENIGKRSHPAR